MSQTSIEKLIEVVNLLRGIDDDMQCQTISCLLEICNTRGLNIKELGNKARVAQSSASRNAAMLSSYGKPKNGLKGFGLIEFKDDPMDRRIKIMSLSKKGEKLLKSLNGIIEK